MDEAQGWPLLWDRGVRMHACGPAFAELYGGACRLRVIATRSECAAPVIRLALRARA